MTHGISLQRVRLYTNLLFFYLSSYTGGNVMESIIESTSTSMGLDVEPEITADTANTVEKGV